MLSSSFASPGFVVTRFRNMSVAMMELPKRYDSTIWNALRKMKKIPHQTITPDLRASEAKAVYAPKGRRMPATVAHSGFFSVYARTATGSMSAAT